MNAELYWIDGMRLGRLAIAPRPRGGEWLNDEIKSWRQIGVTTVVSMLTADEVSDLDLVQEASSCKGAGLEFISFPVADRSIPLSKNHALGLARDLANRLASGKHVLIHCRAGMGRSALLVACIMVLLGSTSEDAFQQIVMARGCKVPDTLEQRRWVTEIAAALNKPVK